MCFLIMTEKKFMLHDNRKQSQERTISPHSKKLKKKKKKRGWGGEYLQGAGVNE